MADRVIDAGVPIHATDQGSGPPVLLMHGNPDSRHGWSPVLRALGDGVRVVAPDFPGFGDSPEPPSGFDFLPQAQADLWERFAQGVGLDEPVVLAVHDFGGPWLLPWAVRHPERIRGLVLSNTLFHTDYRWHPWARVWQTPGLGEASALLSPRALFRWEMRRGDPALPQDHADDCHRRMVPGARRTVLRTYRAYARPARAFDGWTEALLSLAARVPTRVYWGALDPYIGPRYAHAWGVEPDRVTVLPDAGHWACVSRPEGYAKVIRQVLVESA